MAQVQYRLRTNAINLVRLADIGSLLRRNPLAVVGLVLLGIFCFGAVFGPLLAPFPPESADPVRTFLPPGGAHLMGTDQYGEDIWSRVLWATRVDLLIAVGAVATALVIGCPLGAFAGYAGGWWDEAVMRPLDVLQAFPTFVLAMGLVVALGPSVPSLILVIGLVNVPVYARLLRSRMLVVKQALYATAAVGVGNPRWRVLVVHLVPNCMMPALVQSSLQAGWAVLSAAGLSFIGLGVRVPEAEWGVMVAMGAPYIGTGQWWISLFPGLCAALVVMAFSLVGDSLQVLLDPEAR